MVVSSKRSSISSSQSCQSAACKADYLLTTREQNRTLPCWKLEPQNFLYRLEPMQRELAVPEACHPTLKLLTKPKPHDFNFEALRFLKTSLTGAGAAWCAAMEATKALS